MLPHSEGVPSDSSKSKRQTTMRAKDGQLVSVLDDDPARLERIKRTLAPFETAFEKLDNISLKPEAGFPSRSSLVLVALNGSVSANQEILEGVRRLKSRELKVVCYGDRTDAWPLGQRCGVLVAGACTLLDSAKQGFDEELRRAVEKLLRDERAKRGEEESLKSTMKKLGVVGESASMLAIFRWVLRASHLSDLPALITGETGTGKELLVNAIRQLDAKRAGGPLIALNCAAISQGLAESELFGHRRGAFTGADEHRKGLIRAAQGGTLFLDEVGELDEHLQTKLLRVLQENRVQAVGEDRDVSVNVRVIAATNRDLREMVREGSFRADLFHRLNILSVNIPPLRERPTDLRPLVEHFIHKHSAFAEKQSLAVAPDFVEALMEVELPGNARQLENFVRWSLVNKEDDGPLNLADLPPEIWHELLSKSGGDSAPSTSVEDNGSQASPDAAQELHARLLELLSRKGWNLSESLAHCEKLMIESAYEHASGNQAQAARLLGITPRSVYNKLRKHQLS